MGIFFSRPTRLPVATRPVVSQNVDPAIGPTLLDANVDQCKIKTATGWEIFSKDGNACQDFAAGRPFQFKPGFPPHFPAAAKLAALPIERSDPPSCWEKTTGSWRQIAGITNEEDCGKALAELPHTAQDTDWANAFYLNKDGNRGVTLYPLGEAASECVSLRGNRFHYLAYGCHKNADKLEALEKVRVGLEPGGSSYRKLCHRRHWLGRK